MGSDPGTSSSNIQRDTETQNTHCSWQRFVYQRHARMSITMVLANDIVMYPSAPHRRIDLENNRGLDRTSASERVDRAFDARRAHCILRRRNSEFEKRPHFSAPPARLVVSAFSAPRHAPMRGSICGTRCARNFHGECACPAAPTLRLPTITETSLLAQ